MRSCSRSCTLIATDDSPCMLVLTTASSSLPHRYAFFHLLQAPEPRYALLQQTQLVIYLLDLLLDKCEAVRRMANLCLDVVIEAEEYQDAVALNNAMASLHMNQPLDAAALDDAGYADEAGYGGAYGDPGLDGADFGAGGDGYGAEAMGTRGYSAYGGADPYGSEYGAGLEAYGQDTDQDTDLYGAGLGRDPSLAHGSAALRNAASSHLGTGVLDGYADGDDGGDDDYDYDQDDDDGQYEFGRGQY